MFSSGEPYRARELLGAGTSFVPHVFATGRTLFTVILSLDNMA